MGAGAVRALDAHRAGAAQPWSAAIRVGEDGQFAPKQALLGQLVISQGLILGRQLLKWEVGELVGERQYLLLVMLFSK